MTHPGVPTNFLHGHIQSLHNNFLAAFFFFKILTHQGTDAQLQTVFLHLFLQKILSGYSKYMLVFYSTV